MINVTSRDLQAAIVRRNAAIGTPDFEARQNELKALVDTAKSEQRSKR